MYTFYRIIELQKHCWDDKNRRLHLAKFLGNEDYKVGVAIDTKRNNKTVKCVIEDSSGSSCYKLKKKPLSLHHQEKIALQA